jgi:hypothetical protein
MDWKPTQFLSPQDIEEALQKVHQGLQYGTTQTNKKYPRNWIRFVLPDDDLDDELWDIATSPVWEDAQVQVLKITMDTLREDGWKKSAFLELPRQPLAKLIAPFQQACNVLGTNDDLSEYSSRLQGLPTVMELGDVSFQ